MNTKDLLTNAAQSANIIELLEWDETLETFFFRKITAFEETSDLEWNPLRIDSDALRLAVKLQLEVTMTPPYTEVIKKFDNGSEIVTQVDHKEDPYRATRIAITMCAAKI